MMYIDWNSLTLFASTMVIAFIWIMGAIIGGTLIGEWLENKLNTRFPFSLVLPCLGFIIPMFFLVGVKI